MADLYNYPLLIFSLTAAPNQPNGNITEYHVLQSQQPSDPPQVIFSGLAFALGVSDLAPFTSYSFQVVAENSAGNVTSIPTTVTTLQAPPTSLAPPLVTVLSATEIRVSWSPPGQLNGVLLGYQVYRDGVPLLTPLTTSLSLLEQDLEPFTEYGYFVEACGVVGCVNSTVVSNTTLEALPELVSDLVVTDVSPRSLELTWEEPGVPNGIITEYVVTRLGEEVEVFRGINTTITVRDLLPFTDYTFHLMVCNNVGCAGSNLTQVQTLETDPEGLDMPVLRNLTSTSVAVRWTPPARPNGLISHYVLRRGEIDSSTNATIIFTGLNTSFNDLDLAADTLYFYTIEAFNGGGSLISARSLFRTVPDLAEGMAPPILEVRGAREIAVSWSAPERPNGVISSYRLYQDNEEVFAGLGFSYLASGLAPFTPYSFFVEACNQAGCASSISISARTAQALVTGVAPPLLTVLGPTTINVSWTPPTQINGVITQYQIRRRLAGDIFSETVQHAGPPDVLFFPNSGLSPFTSYEYRLRVTNGAGSVLTPWVSARTSEDTPTGLAPPMFADEDVRARNVTAIWTPPTSPNGVLLRYELEYRLTLDPITFEPGDLVVVGTIPADTTITTATGLSPVTEYEFRVVAVNGAGRGEGPFQAVMTREDAPEGIQPLIVESRTSSSLTLRWNPPLLPNGIVQEYRILLDGRTVYQDSALTHTITGLRPFTSYGIQLGACTSAACAFGGVQSATTAESAPLGQGGPSLEVLEAEGGVAVRWSLPTQPNGIITRYEVLRQVGGDANTLGVVSSTSNLTYVDSDVSPAQSYQYAIRSFNSAGNTQSVLVSITTPEAAPQALAPPTLTTLNSSAIQVSWSPPAQPNGVVILYQVFRTGNGAQNLSVFSDPVTRVFADSDLSPATPYTYVVQACTAAGCALSPIAVATTNEATPTNLRPPILEALSEVSIAIQWVEPATPNGVITGYVLVITPAAIRVEIPVGTTLSRNISNLLPFTEYTVRLEACNSAGCVSNTSLVITLESTPGFTPPPMVSAINATSTNVSWAEPRPPNGIITLYELRRNGSLVFSGRETEFVDVGLTPDQFYVYTIQARTSAGIGSESALSAVVRTPRDTPEGVSPPILRPTGPASILASWTPPSQPNGVIQRYMLLVGGESVFQGLGLEFEVRDLRPFTSYQFQLLVCTSTCGSSSLVSASTLEALPQDQQPPSLRENAQLSLVEVSWPLPLTPNGFITRFELERRRVFMDGSASDYILVFNGSGVSYRDMDASLRPATRHQYRVSSFNSAGSATSPASNITLAEAAPEGVPRPTVDDITSTSITLSVTPPTTPNGVITMYRLFQNGEQVLVIDAAASENRFDVTGLEFYTEYVFFVEACTQAGCTRSGTVILRTSEAPPTGLSPPVGVAQSERVIMVTWSPPQQPNGILLRLAPSTELPPAPNPFHPPKIGVLQASCTLRNPTSQLSEPSIIPYGTQYNEHLRCSVKKLLPPSMSTFSPSYISRSF